MCEIRRAKSNLFVFCGKHQFVVHVDRCSFSWKQKFPNSEITIHLQWNSLSQFDASVWGWFFSRLILRFVSETLFLKKGTFFYTTENGEFQSRTKFFFTVQFQWNIGFLGLNLTENEAFYKFGFLNFLLWFASEKIAWCFWG